MNSRPRAGEGKKVNRRDPLVRLMQFYHAAKRQAWDVNTLGWDELPPVPRMDEERWQAIWASVVKQQLQADTIAVEAAGQLLLEVEEVEAKLYYSTMVQDEARHLEGWTRLDSMLDDVEGTNPYLSELGEMILDTPVLEHKVVGFQVWFEGAVIPAFKDIAESARTTVLGEMATKLIRDDSIHHNSGVAYAEHLLARASPGLLSDMGKRAKKYAPVYIEYMLWRPPARQWLNRFMKQKDGEMVYRNKVFVNKALSNVGIDPPFDI